MLQRYEVAAARGMQVALAFEETRSNSRVLDASNGITTDLSALLRARGYEIETRISADLISLGSAGPEDDRLIEVKTRGGRGNINGLFERQLNMFRVLGDRAWLYVVFNVTQPQPVELRVLRNPAGLPWVETHPAERKPGEARGTRHEARYDLPSVAIQQSGELVNLTDLSLPAWAGASRD